MKGHVTGIAYRYLSVQKSRLPGAGKGLFTKLDIKKGDRIVEYAAISYDSTELRLLMPNPLEAEKGVTPTTPWDWPGFPAYETMLSI